MSSASKKQKIAGFDPNAAGTESGRIFGLPFGFEDAEVVLLPVPWEVTVSFAEGTARGAEAIRDASTQVDLYDPDLNDAWKHGIYMMDISGKWKKRSATLRPKARELIRYQEKGGNPEDENTLQQALHEINDAGENLMHWVHNQTSRLMQHGKLVGVVGGEHSVSLGFIRALANKYESFGILQIDAHYDLREAYEGFLYSHASIMHHVLGIEQVGMLVPVGVRDFSESEQLRVDSEEKITAFPMHLIHEKLFNGSTWKNICDEIIRSLPQNLYISFDIDGLDPGLCPNTGTPVPGGLSMPQITYLLRQLAGSGKKIIGFDLVEVAPGEGDWDGNVGARVLYKLCNMMLKSQSR